MHKADDVTRPTDKELLEWAAEQRKKYERGELSEWEIAAIEKIPGWTWDIEEARRLGL